MNEEFLLNKSSDQSETPSNESLAVNQIETKSPSAEKSINSSHHSEEEKEETPKEPNEPNDPNEPKSGSLGKVEETQPEETEKRWKVCWVAVGLVCFVLVLWGGLGMLSTRYTRHCEPELTTSELLAHWFGFSKIGDCRIRPKVCRTFEFSNEEMGFWNQLAVPEAKISPRRMKKSVEAVDCEALRRAEEEMTDFEEPVVPNTLQSLQWGVKKAGGASIGGLEKVWEIERELEEVGEVEGGLLKRLWEGLKNFLFGRQLGTKKEAAALRSSIARIDSLLSNPKSPGLSASNQLRFYGGLERALSGDSLIALKARLARLVSASEGQVESQIRFTSIKARLFELLEAQSHCPALLGQAAAGFDRPLSPQLNELPRLQAAARLANAEFRNERARGESQLAALRARLASAEKAKATESKLADLQADVASLDACLMKLEPRRRLKVRIELLEELLLLRHEDDMPRYTRQMADLIEKEQRLDREIEAEGSLTGKTSKEVTLRAEISKGIVKSLTGLLRDDVEHFKVNTRAWLRLQSEIENFRAGFEASTLRPSSDETQASLKRQISDLMLRRQSLRAEIAELESLLASQKHDLPNPKEPAAQQLQKIDSSLRQATQHLETLLPQLEARSVAASNSLSEFSSSLAPEVAELRSDCLRLETLQLGCRKLGEQIETARIELDRLGLHLARKQREIETQRTELARLMGFSE